VMLNSMRKANVWPEKNDPFPFKCGLSVLLSGLAPKDCFGFTGLHLGPTE
jgi:hypothetical protein